MRRELSPIEAALGAELTPRPNPFVRAYEAARDVERKLIEVLHDGITGNLFVDYQQEEMQQLNDKWGHIAEMVRVEGHGVRINRINLAKLAALTGNEKDIITTPLDHDTDVVGLAPSRLESRGFVSIHDADRRTLKLFHSTRPERVRIVADSEESGGLYLHDRYLLPIDGNSVIVEPARPDSATRLALTEHYFPGLNAEMASSVNKTRMGYLPLESLLKLTLKDTASEIDVESKKWIEQTLTELAGVNPAMDYTVSSAQTILVKRDEDGPFKRERVTNRRSLTARLNSVKFDRKTGGFLIAGDQSFRDGRHEVMYPITKGMHIRPVEML